MTGTKIDSACAAEVLLANVRVDASAVLGNRSDRVATLDRATGYDIVAPTGSCSVR
jgi:hypothetical protein